VRGKFVESGLKILRNHSCLPDHRNKVGISFPARNNLKMQVTRYPGSSTFPDIESNLEAIGLINAFALTGQHRHCIQLGRRNGTEVGDMPAGDDQQMACCIGIRYSDKGRCALEKAE